MLKVAILDDYQNVSQQFVDLNKLSGKYEFKIFSSPFEDEADGFIIWADKAANMLCGKILGFKKFNIKDLYIFFHSIPWGWWFDPYLLKTKAWAISWVKVINVAYGFKSLFIVIWLPFLLSYL